MTRFVCVFILAGSVAALAQTAEKPALASTVTGAAKVAPVADELDKAWMDAVVIAAQSEQDALDAVKATAEYKKYETRQKTRASLQTSHTEKIEKKYPGYTIDWTKRVIVPKEKK